MASFVQNVRVDHGCADVLVAQEFLDRSDIVTGFDQTGSEGVPERVAPHVLGDVCPSRCLFDCPLEYGFLNVVSPFLSGLGVLPSVLPRKDRLPAPFCGGVGVLAVESHRQLHAPPAVGKVALVDRLDLLQVVLERTLQGFRQHRDPVFGALAVSDEYFVR